MRFRWPADRVHGWNAGRATVVAGLLLACASVARAETAAGTLTFTFENDTTLRTDRYYTNGVQIAFQSTPRADSPESRLATWLAPWLLPEGEGFYGVSIAQSFYTPNDTESARPPRDDRPYAGWLRGSAALFASGNDQLGMLELSLGVIGPSALGSETQEFVHDVLGVPRANGWDHQIGNVPAGQLSLERRLRFTRPLGETFEWGVVPAGGLSLGNAQTSMAAGVLLRFGKGLDVDFGPPRMRPSLGAGIAFESPRRFSWYGFAGIEGRAVAYDQTLDGNRDDYWRIQTTPLVGEATAGVALAWPGARFSLAWIVQSDTFREQRKQPFGYVSASFAFRF